MPSNKHNHIALLLALLIVIASPALAQDSAATVVPVRIEVSISGEVKVPGKYAVNKGERLSSVLAKAGGFTDKAYLRGAWLTRESARADQQKALEDLTRRLAQELFWQVTAREPQAPTGPGEVRTPDAIIEQKTQLIGTLKKLKAKGRVKISLAHLRLLKGSEHDIELENGDVLVIPEKATTVRVAGSVKAPNRFTYIENCPFKAYVSSAGGFSEYADTDNSFVMKVDGSTIKLTGDEVVWNEARRRWEIAYFTQDKIKIEAGDVILIPERLAWQQEIKDFPKILMTTAELTGTTVYMN